MVIMFSASALCVSYVLAIYNFLILETLNKTQNQAGAEGKVLLYTVDGKEYKSYEQYLTGAQIRKAADAPQESLESMLFLAITPPWKDELIKSDEPVDIAREGIEHFYIKNILLLIINGKEFIWDKQYISGAQIKQLGGVPLVDDLFLTIRGPWEDEPIPNEKQVNLARPGIENFYSKKPVVYTFYIDKKVFTTSEQYLTVRQILVDFAKVDPACNTLAEKIPGGFHEFKNLDEKLDLCNVRHFTIFNNTPTSVS